MNRELRLTLYGEPAGKGSLKCVGQKGQHRIVEDNPLTSGWRDLVAATAAAAWDSAELPADYEPVGVEITTTVARPKGHYGTGRNEGKVKASAPLHPTRQVNKGTADVDKFARLILDALVDAGVLGDDAQVVECLTRKAYPSAEVPDALDAPGVRVRVYPFDPWWVGPDPFLVAEEES